MNYELLSFPSKFLIGREEKFKQTHIVRIECVMARAHDEIDFGRIFLKASNSLQANTRRNFPISDSLVHVYSKTARARHLRL